MLTALIWSWYIFHSSFTFWVISLVFILTLWVLPSCFYTSVIFTFRQILCDNKNIGYMLYWLYYKHVYLYPLWAHDICWMSRDVCEKTWKDKNNKLWLLLHHMQIEITYSFSKINHISSNLYYIERYIYQHTCKLPKSVSTT